MRWEIDRSAQANADLFDILRWTARRFGADQASRYSQSMIGALASLQRGPEHAGARRRPELGPSVWSIRVGKGRQGGRHVVLVSFDAAARPPTVRVLRILHTAMDPSRHLDPDDAPA